MRARVLYLFLLLWLIVASSLLSAQGQPPVSDPKAVALASQAIVALTNGVSISDATLSGDATWIAGSDKETGSATLLAKGTGQSRIDLKLNSGTRTEVRNDTAGSQQGESIATDGSVQPWPQHNCWINGAWFFPALSMLSAPSDPSVIITYIGLESRGGMSVQHLRAYSYLASKSSALTALTQTLSTEDIYLDSASLLPTAFSFNTHPDDDEATNILVEVDFSDFQTMNGVQVPTRVQKLINGGLALDITITSIALNSGLSDSPFAIQ